MKYKRSITIIFYLLLVVGGYVLWPTLSYSATNSTSVSGTCDKKGTSGPCWLTVDSGAYEAYQGNLTAHLEGHGVFGPSGGKGGANGCLNINGVMWTGSCWLLVDAQDPAQGNVGDSSRDFDVTNSVSLGSNFKYWIIEFYANDATWDSIDSTVTGYAPDAGTLNISASPTGGAPSSVYTSNLYGVCGNSCESSVSMTPSAGNCASQTLVTGCPNWQWQWSCTAPSSDQTVNITGASDCGAVNTTYVVSSITPPPPPPPGPPLPPPPPPGALTIVPNSAEIYVGQTVTLTAYQGSSPYPGAPTFWYSDEGAQCRTSATPVACNIADFYSASGPDVTMIGLSPGTVNLRFWASNASSPSTITVSSNPFTYTLTNSGTSNVTKTSGTAYTTNTITKTLNSGTAQAVNLTLLGVPPVGVTYSITNNPGDPANPCAASCQSVINFNVASNAPTGDHTITVTGTISGFPDEETTFTLHIDGDPLVVSCSPSVSVAEIGENIIWTANASGGSGNYTYSWSGTNIPTNPAPYSSSFGIVYGTVGPKTATVLVTDTPAGATDDCSGTVQVSFDPSFEEF